MRFHLPRNCLRLAPVICAALVYAATAAAQQPPSWVGYLSKNTRNAALNTRDAVRPSGLAPVGLISQQQFQMFSAAWAQLHQAVMLGSVETLKNVVRNPEGCKGNKLAIRAELLMESRANIPTASGATENTMRELISGIGKDVKPEQLGEAGTPFLVVSKRSNRIGFGNMEFIEGPDRLWNIDLGC
jgi:hypothetical protein